MKKTIYVTIWLLVTQTMLLRAQKAEPRMITTDIDHFWQAYDSVRTTNDSLRQLAFIQTLYIDRGTPGLEAFMALKRYTAPLWVHQLRSYPKFWNSIRPNTEKLKTLSAAFEPGIDKLKKLYPALKPAKIYGCIGALASSGTAQEGKVLIGAEMVTGGPETDLSEFPENMRARLSAYYGTLPFNSIVLLNIHEYAHTQQSLPEDDLLSQCLYEGACDFVVKLVTGKEVPLPYMEYGPANEAALKEKFKAEMYGTSYRNWLYNSGGKGKVGDLGYYMGYTICQAYYNKAANKKQALKTILELPYGDSVAVGRFLAQSGYYGGAVDKAALVKAYDDRRPYVVQVSPFTNGDVMVDASIKEIRVEFSAEMNPLGISIDYGIGGKDSYPVVGKGVFAADRKSMSFKVELQPGRMYGFLLTDGSFRSTDDYPLKPFMVTFRTK
ncbi:hypothetical protein [Chitinophaga nivalis]|uniref:SbsA Ig-like domain-containing protein n=1 Tax=Chitinophaga nivalis TaxID=2991709 RepID=A0ABT3IK25_9BACT|nr:hypothetical protein [Chitinophaga nivalis]MCW3465988.1 hypothetical protein [Chitinophaga nivalis]MCW3484321.1 hypothetical protein [Chitinophaga nivalis]